MFVIGTAGHVDHGKSTLVKALTGIDPDRLAEEKAREMTIDLGFAWLRLDGIDEEVGVVDVPGHRDFIENMLAGVGGIDLALFVIAADEGVMPQTREHLAILDLLEINRAIIAITKIDMVDDPEWVELVSLEVAEVFEGTVLENAPILPVSAHTGEGIPELKAAVAEHLLAGGARTDTGRPRLSIDRVFSISGFGTIVTGTLIDGQLRIGDEIVVQPSGLSGRVRGLQTHKTKLEVARPGSRVAINLSGIDKNDVKRGSVVTIPGIISPTLLVDVSYRHLADADLPLKHNTEVKLFIGSAETIARVRLIGSEKLEPGTEGFLQLALRDPLPTVRGDRFILRRPSPGATIGGGYILDPQPGRQHRRFKPDAIGRLETLSKGAPDELMLQQLRRMEPAKPDAVRQQMGIDADSFATLLTDSLNQGRTIELGAMIVSAETWHKWKTTVEKLTVTYHRENPLRAGISREEVRSRLKLKAVVFNPFVVQLVEQSIVEEEAALLKTPGHTVTFSDRQQQAIDKLVAQYSSAGVNAPSVKEAQAIVGGDVYQAQLDMQTLVQVSKDVVWLKADYDSYVAKATDFLCKNDSMSAGDLRDQLGTTRKYAIGLLEHLDSIGLTRRVGDARELVKKTDICG